MKQEQCFGNFEYFNAWNQATHSFLKVAAQALGRLQIIQSTNWPCEVGGLWSRFILSHVDIGTTALTVRLTRWIRGHRQLVLDNSDKTEARLLKGFPTRFPDISRAPASRHQWWGQINEGDYGDPLGTAFTRPWLLCPGPKRWS